MSAHEQGGEGLAQGALGALDAMECEYCGESNPELNTASPSWCVHCPFCGCSPLDECEHLLAAENEDADDGFNYSPFVGVDLPCLPEELDVDRDWSDAQTAEVFGNLVPLLEAYEDEGLWESPWPLGLWRQLVGMLSVPIESVDGANPDSMVSSTWQDHFSEHREEVRAEIAVIMGRLVNGFERLAGMEPEGEPLKGDVRFGALAPDQAATTDSERERLDDDVDPPGVKVLAQWGVPGNGPGQFQAPTGLVIDGQGSVYLADSGNHRIQKLSATGESLAQWGTAGDGPGEFKEPCGVAVDAHGNVYVADRGNHRVQKLSPAGEPVAQWGMGRAPAGIAVDAVGNIYVTMVASVERLSNSGDLLASWGTLGRGRGQLLLPKFLSPKGIAVDEEGNVYVADTGWHRIQKLSVQDEQLTQLGSMGDGPGQLRRPWDVAVDGAGMLYVVDAERDCVHRLSPQGESLAELGSTGDGPGQFQNPRGVAVDGLGNLYVADTGNNRIQKFSLAQLGRTPERSGDQGSGAAAHRRTR